jgi:hypothetical protein
MITTANGQLLTTLVTGGRVVLLADDAAVLGVLGERGRL